ncbi:MAG: tetratricopeptide repeat protein [Polyangiales bacterium]
MSEEKSGDQGRELTADQVAELEKLDDAITKFEEQKRWSDMIRSILSKAELVPSPAEKVELFRQAGKLYLERSSNQAEAIKCFEQLLEYEPQDVDAIEQLKQMYEKRRDWEKLIRTMQREVELLPQDQRLLRYHEMADLATQRLRKPAVCIELWQKVLEDDPSNPSALENLAQLYERAREWEPLAEVLETLVAADTDVASMKQQLQKLGMIYADKIGNDEGAIRAFKQLLELEPSDRRAQEQLKRRYVSLGAWDELEAFYAANEKWDELIRIVERQAEAQETASEDKIPLLFRAARLWEHEKGKPDRAARVYEKILTADPDNVKAAEALTPIYEEAHDARKLVSVLEVRFAHAVETESKVELLGKIGRVFEERLRQPDVAFERYLEAFALAPTHDDARADVERLAEELNGWDRLVSGFESAIEAVSDSFQAVPIRLSYGQTLVQLDRIDEAIAQFEQVYGLESDSLTAIAALGDLYLQTQRFRELLDIYARRIELEEDPEARLAVAYRRARLFAEDLGETDYAIRAFEGIVDEYGVDQSDACEELERLYESGSRWAELSQLLERRIEAGPESHEELASLKFRLGRVCESRLQDKGRAVDLYREVLSLLSEHDGAKERLEQLLDDDEVAAEASRVLEPVYEMNEEWSSYVNALRVQSRLSDEPRQKLDLLSRVADTYFQHIGDDERGFASLCEAFREMPSDVGTLKRLELMAAEHDMFEAVAELTGDLAASVEDIPLSRSLWIKTAQIHESQLGDLEAAVSAYRKVLEVNAGDFEVLGALEALYRGAERWHDLVGALRSRTEASSHPDDKITVLAEMARIHADVLDEPDQAIALQNEILEIDPTNREALSTLDVLLARRGLWSDLADNVERQLSLADESQERTILLLRLAEIRERRMASTESAIEIYRDVLANDASNPAALGALERLLESSEHQAAVADILEPIYEDTNASARLVEVYEIQAHHATSPERRLELFHQIAKLQEFSLSDLHGAFESYARAFREDPGHPRSKEELERLSAAVGASDALASVYEQVVASADDPHLAVTLLLRAAEIREEDLGQLDRAIEHYERVLQLDELHHASADALERLFQQTERYEDLAGIYGRKARMAPSVLEQREQLVKAAAIYEDILDKPSEAIAVYQQVLEIDPEDIESLDRLIELQMQLGKWSPLLESYERKAEVVTDPELRKDLFTAMGRVFEGQLEDSDKAIDAYQRVLEIDPDDVTALGHLDALYAETAQWRDLLQVLERESELVAEDDARIELRFRIGELWRCHLEDPIRAIEIYRDILSEAPDHRPTLEALRTMAEDAVEPLAAAEVLEEVYLSAGEYRKLAEAREVKVRFTEDPRDRVEMLHQLAEIYEIQLEDLVGAFQAFIRALPLDLRDDLTLASLERLAEQTGKWHEVASRFDEEVNKKRDESPEEVIHLARRSAVINEVQLDDVDSAISRYQFVVDIEPSDVTSIEALDRLYEQTERWDDLAATLRIEAAVATTPEDVLNLQFRTGQIFQNRLDNVDSAIAQYREIIAAAPEYEPAVSALEDLFAHGVRPLEIGEVLEPLYRMQGNWNRLLSVQEVQVEHQNDPIERVVMMHRLAEIAEDKASDHARAFSWMQKAVLEDPSHDHSIGEAERLSAIVDGWTELASTYANGIQHAGDPISKAELGRRLAKVYEEQLQDLERAEETYRFVLGVDDHDEKALAALDRIYSKHGAYRALAQVLRKRIEGSSNSSELIDLQYRLGTVLDHQLGCTEEALEVFHKLLDQHDSEHAPTIQALQRIYANLERWPELFSAFEKELSIALGDSQQAEVFARMARLSSNRLRDPEKAIGLWQRVLDLRGEDPEALNALGDIYASQGNWRDLVDVLEREAAVATDGAFRVQVYSDLARVWYEKLERERNAIENWERVLDIDPANTYALFSIAEIQRAGGQSRERADTLHRIIDVGAATLEDADLITVYMQLGHIYANELRQPSDAVDAYQNVLNIDPAFFEALDSLELIHREEGEWEAVAGVMEQRALALVDPHDKVRQLIAVTELWEHRVGDKDRGAGAFGRILEVDPMHEYAFSELQTLHKEAGRWDELIDLYVTRIESTEDRDERIELLRAAARVYEEQLGDGEQAYHTLYIAWTEDFSNKNTAVDLERVTAANDKWNELLTSANHVLQENENPETQIAICLCCAKWYGQDLGHPEYAIPYYEQIRALDPSNAKAWWQLGDLYETTHQWDKLAQALAKLVELTGDDDVKADTYVRMGDLADDRFAMRQEAEDYYRRALQLKDKHVGALEALERIYREEGRSNKLLNILERKAEAVQDVDSVVAALLQVAEAYEERFDDTRAAIENYEKAAELAPSDLRALRGLERLYQQEGRYQDLVGILEREYEVVATERERIEILTRLSEMWEQEFRKPDNAADRLEQVLDIDPLHDEALCRLEQLYRTMQRWDDLVRTYDRHASATADAEERLRIFRELGEVYGTYKNEVEQAIDSYLNALNLNDRDVISLRALSKLYERKGDHAAALDILGQLAAVVDEPADRVRLKHRMGCILDQELGDRVTALEQFQAAVDLDPSHLPSLAAMRRIHVDSGDWLAAAKTIGLEVQHTESDRARAALLVEMGRIRADRLDDEAGAVEAFEAAASADPDNEEALMPLVDSYLAAERHQDAFPLLQVLVQRSDKREADERHRLALLLGETATRLGHANDAVGAYERAYALDNDDPVSLKGLAGSYFRAQRWDDAFKHHQVLLVQHRDALGRDEITEVFYRLGIIKREQGEDKKARNMFDKALEEDTHFVPALEAMVELQSAEGDWDSVVQYKKRILDVTDEPAARAKLLIELGDLWQERLGEPDAAAEAYTEALDLDPDNHVVLHKLLVTYQAAERWSEAIDAIERICEIEERAEAKAKYTYTIGVILRDKLEDEDAALERFNEALDLDSTQLKPFEAINKLLNTRKDWKALERAYRKMLHRIISHGNTDLEHNLWHTLGIIYRDRQRNFDAAAEAFKMAARLKPDDAVQHQILAELYATMPDRTVEAIEEHQWLLSNDPNRLDSYRALYKLYFDARAYDKAWCIARTLSYFEKADEEQQKFYQQYRQDREIQPKTRLSNENWVKDLMHPDQDLYISKIMEVIAPAVRASLAVPDKKLNLHKRKPEDLANPSLALARQFKLAQDVLNVTIPVRLFIQKELSGALRDEPRSNPPAIITGYTLLSGYRPVDLAFVCGRHLTYYRAEHFIRTMYHSHTELRTLLLAAMRLVNMGGGDASVDSTAKQLAKYMDQSHVDVLKRVVRKFVDSGGQADVKRWMQATEVTSLRAGLLLCDDVDTAVRMIQQIPSESTADLAPRDKVKEIVLYSISESYFQLREQLGIQIKV